MTDVRPAVAPTATLDVLSPAEREVLRLALDGVPNKLIARRLGISDRRAPALQRLGVGSVVEAAKAHATPPAPATAVLPAAFQESATGLALVERDGRIAAANPDYCRFFGYSEADLLGRGVELVTHADDLAATRAVMQRLFADEIRELRARKHYVCGNGDVLIGEVSAAAVPGPDGLPSYSVAQVVPAADA